MISVNNITFRFASRVLYQDAGLHIKPKDRIGLIGANGTGKSTLLRLLTGEYTPDEGSISKSGGTTIGFLNQDLLSYQSQDSILHVTMQAFERALIVQHELEEVLAKMETEYSDELLEKMTHLQEEYEAMDGYTLQSRAEEILEGLGFLTEHLQKPLASFSGGWRMRVMLAKLLLQKPDLLMLDEPTNHLDLPSIEWLEEYIKEYEGAILLVSHDRRFINNTVNAIVEVSGQRFNHYAGNYDFYLEEKSMRQEIQKNAFENQQSQIRQTERFIERFKAKASKARQVQSRVKALEKLDLIDDVVDETARVNFRFIPSVTSGRFVTELEGVSKSYNDLLVLDKVNGVIERGDKIGFVGANGKGKSTLLRIIYGSEPVQGEVKPGYNVVPSFFAQHQLESLNIENTLLEELQQTGSTKTETELRSVLGCFLFSGEDVFKKIKVLSGGEKSRVALAKTLISNANFLLLDEPTNHLDIISVNILIQALQQYEGTFLVVSHDRFFIEQVANKIWYIENHELKVYPGTFDEWEEWMANRKPDLAAGDSANTRAGKQTKQEKTASNKPQNDELKETQKAIDEAEAKIERLESEKNTLLAQLADGKTPPDKMASLGKQLKSLEQSIEFAMEHWQSLAQKLETLKTTV